MFGFFSQRAGAFSQRIFQKGIEQDTVPSAAPAATSAAPAAAPADDKLLA